MQVILMEKVANLGGLGDVVKVKDGFARNFLIPQGKARRATAANLKEFESRRSDLEKKAADTLASATERAAKLDLLPMQAGDVPATEADIGALEGAVGFRPQTSVEEGVRRFVAWYRDYYRVAR